MTSAMLPATAFLLLAGLVLVPAVFATRSSFFARLRRPGSAPGSAHGGVLRTRRYF